MFGTILWHELLSMSQSGPVIKLSESVPWQITINVLLRTALAVTEYSTINTEMLWLWEAICFKKQSYMSKQITWLQEVWYMFASNGWQNILSSTYHLQIILNLGLKYVHGSFTRKFTFCIISIITIKKKVCSWQWRSSKQSRCER